MTRGDKVIAFIERYCKVPEGKHVGKPLRLMDFQKKFIRDVYDNPHGTRRAYLSIGRKNGKSALISCLVLAHLVGPEARQNSQIISGARSREQAALVYKLAEKMVRFSPELTKIVKATPSSKMLTGLTMNVEYKGIAAEAGTAHGLSPALAILDETGQIKGPYDAFVEAIETAQGAHDAPLLIAISTQAPTDNDLFSIWLDDAVKNKPKDVVCHLYSAPAECELDDEAAWRAANPAMGEFRSTEDIEALAQQAMRLPTAENTFRWLYLNQRVQAESPFVSVTLWKSCAGTVPDFDRLPVYGGLDLSEVQDLTALVLVAPVDGVWHIRPTFWLPGDGLVDKAKADRFPYDVHQRNGHLLTAPGKTVEYEYVAEHLRGVFDRYDVRSIAFDRWNFRHLKPWLLKAGFSEDVVATKFVEIGQGFQSMSPALRELESKILSGRLVHPSNPVLNWCATNAVVQRDPAGNRKLAKDKSHGRIDGMVALAMAMSVAATHEEQPVSYLETAEMLVL